MLRRFTAVFSLAAALLGACGRDSVDVPEVRTPMPATLAGVYSGRFPCSNCAAIEATVWLRPDGAFFLRQRFEGEAAGGAAEQPQPPSATFAFGRWSWDEIAAEAVLRGPGPERRLTPRDEDRLQLRVASPVEHVLAREAAAPHFVDRVTLDGESAVSESGATFKECRTGLTFTVADAGAYRELRRQHRRMNPRGKIAVTTIEGHFVVTERDSTTSERLVVDRFITMKPGKGC